MPALLATCLFPVSVIWLSTGISTTKATSTPCITRLFIVQKLAIELTSFGQSHAPCDLLNLMKRRKSLDEVQWIAKIWASMSNTSMINRRNESLMSCWKESTGGSCVCLLFYRLSLVKNAVESHRNCSANLTVSRNSKGRP